MCFASSLLVVAVVLIALYVLAALIFPERFECATPPPAS